MVLRVSLRWGCCGCELVAGRGWTAVGAYRGGLGQMSSSWRIPVYCGGSLMGLSVGCEGVWLEAFE